MPASPAAVAAGNVEMSSRVADLVIAALGCKRPRSPAQGQGTMNNLTLAGDAFTYYETLGGGQGACPDAPGPSAEHVAMSNTLNTPIEAFESDSRSGSVRSKPGPAAVEPAATSGGEGIAPRDPGAGADALHADHRAPATRAARPAGRRGRRARVATCSTGELVPSKIGGQRSSPATGFASRRRAAAAGAPRRRERRPRVPSRSFIWIVL